MIHTNESDVIFISIPNDKILHLVTFFSYFVLALKLFPGDRKFCEMPVTMYSIHTKYSQINNVMLDTLGIVRNFMRSISNKANLRDLIAATGLVILLKLDLNRRFFSTCDLEIWWMTPKNNRAPLLCYFKLFASFRSHWWIQTGVTVRKRLIWVKIDAF